MDDEEDEDVDNLRTVKKQSEMLFVRGMLTGVMLSKLD